MKKFLLILLCLALATAASAGSALANVAANTQIFTEATLTYDDGTGTQTSKASVTVTVALVPALATISAPADQSAVYGSTNTGTNYSYTVTAGGNGPDTYTLAIATVDATNTSGNSAQLKNITSPVTLGATVTTVGSTKLNIYVPSDGANDGVVNGIEPGDSVVIDGEVRQVDSVVDPETGTATIVLKTSLSSAPAAGVSVWEQKSFDVEVLSGAIDKAGASIKLTVETSVTDSAGKVSDQVVNTFTSGAAVLTKFARNLTDSAANSGGTGGKPFTIGGSSATYYTGGLKAEANDVIEYVLQVENAGTAPVTGCNIHDVLPLEYVTFQGGVFSGKDFLYVDEAGTKTGLTAAADTDTATQSGSDLTFYVGTGATSATSGSIDAGKSVMVVYRVKVN